MYRYKIWNDKFSDKLLDVSQGSQTSSILDQVYNISLQEENVRQELSTVDQKISQLQKLIDEATQQMSKFTEKKETVQTIVPVPGF